MEDQINKTRYTTTNKKRRKILDQIKYHLTKKKEKKREEKFKSNPTILPNSFPFWKILIFTRA